ncbi:hypothetical protein D3C87_1446260 [compost metagenome]
MDLAFIVRPARANRQFPDVRERHGSLAEQGVATVGRVLVEGYVAAQRRRGDRQGRLHQEAFRPFDLLTEHVEPGDPVDVRARLGGQAELLADLLGVLFGAVIDGQWETRERQAAQVVAPAVVVAAVGRQGDDVEMLCPRPFRAARQTPVLALLIIVRRRKALTHVHARAQRIDQGHEGGRGR